MEHVDGFRERFGVQVAPRSVGSDELASTIDNAFVELGVFEDYGAEEDDRDFSKGLVSWEQVGAVEVAEDPVEVFLQLFSTVLILSSI